MSPIRIAVAAIQELFKTGEMKCVRVGVELVAAQAMITQRCTDLGVPGEKPDPYGTAMYAIDPLEDTKKAV